MRVVALCLLAVVPGVSLAALSELPRKEMHRPSAPDCPNLEVRQAYSAVEEGLALFGGRGAALVYIARCDRFVYKYEHSSLSGGGSSWFGVPTFRKALEWTYSMRLDPAARGSPSERFVLIVDEHLLRILRAEQYKFHIRAVRDGQDRKWFLIRFLQ